MSICLEKIISKPENKKPLDVFWHYWIYHTSLRWTLFVKDDILTVAVTLQIRKKKKFELLLNSKNILTLTFILQILNLELLKTSLLRCLETFFFLSRAFSHLLFDSLFLMKQLEECFHKKCCTASLILVLLNISCGSKFSSKIFYSITLSSCSADNTLLKQTKLTGHQADNFKQFSSLIGCIPALQTFSWIDFVQHLVITLISWDCIMTYIQNKYLNVSVPSCLKVNKHLNLWLQLLHFFISVYYSFICLFHFPFELRHKILTTLSFFFGTKRQWFLNEIMLNPITRK